MRLVVVLAFTISALSAAVLEQTCDRCHQKQIPYTMIYKRALLLYSSKSRIKKYLCDFLTNPSAPSSILPPGLKRRFDPSTHPIFDKATACKAIEELIEKEDIIKKLQP